ncbi:hypothetical protein HanXRQr2_Chr05g0214281 [Helianthus annuus]|uniref:Uncharacterized protein n=1 Tax=Helianthus annuus TaxID=4232 RepID=A0A9K3NN27_HELAN|nr:hypothetical protein HanXRQr2_Chr05g0214281 [Helianthus annuus]
MPKFEVDFEKEKIIISIVVDLNNSTSMYKTLCSLLSSLNPNK